MPLTTYCQYDEIRSALGVNHVELPDSVLSLPVYEIGLTRELMKISASLAASFSSIEASSQRTDAEEALFASVRLFSVYLVASQVGISLPLLAPKSVADGKASTTRFSGEPFTAVLEAVQAARDQYRKEIREALDALGAATNTVTAMPTQVRAVNRNYDPVTGS